MLEFRRDLCSDPRFSMEREWLVTNGLGDYASGTVAGVLTRRYHGLLVASGGGGPRAGSGLCDAIDTCIQLTETPINGLPSALDQAHRADQPPAGLTECGWVFCQWPPLDQRQVPDERRQTLGHSRRFTSTWRHIHHLQP